MIRDPGSIERRFDELGTSTSSRVGLRQIHDGRTSRWFFKYPVESEEFLKRPYSEPTGSIAPEYG